MRRSAIVTFAAAALGLGFFLGQPPLTHAQESQDELEQLVAPIALYPDELVAEVLAAATYPSDLDDAAQWLQQYPNVPPDDLAQAVDQADWDSSVKALTEFPDVLAMMDQNLAWTSALGDAYANQPDDVLDAIQALRQRALAAGTLQSNSQIKVIIQDGLISIEPADSADVYVPSYDCWSVYGAAIAPYPEFVLAAGIVRGPHIRWDVRIRLGGEWGRVNWGWHNWSSDWTHRRVVFQRTTWVTHSPSVVDHHYAPRGGEARPEAPTRQPEPAGRAPIGKAVPRPSPAVIGTPRPEPPARASVRPEPAGRAPVGRAVPAPTTPPTAPATTGHPTPPSRGPGRSEPPTTTPPPSAAPPPSRGPGRSEPPPTAPPSPSAPRPAPPASRGPVRPEPAPERASAPRVPTQPPPAPHNADRGFPQAAPKPTTPPSGTKSGAFGGFNHGAVAVQNSTRGQASMNSHPAPPPKPAPPPPKPAAPRRGGRGGQS